MFSVCTVLKSIPDLETSYRKYFSEMFLNCKSINEKPQLNLSQTIEKVNVYKRTKFANDPL